MKEHEYQCPYKSDPVQPNSGKYTFLTTSGYNQTTGSGIYTDGRIQNNPYLRKLVCFKYIIVSFEPLPVIMA